MSEFPISIKDGDLELVKLEPTFENTKMVFDLINKDRDYLGEYLGWVDYIKKPEDEFSQLVKYSKSDNGEFFIKYKDKIVGTMGFHRIEEKNKSGEMGYWLSEGFNGLGIVTNAIKIYEKFVFGKLGFNRSEIRMDVRNKKSESVAKRLGYVKEGCLRNNMFMNNEFRDTFVYSKLKSEWEQENA